MSTTRQEAIHSQCQQFLEKLDAPAFIIIGWKKADEEVEVLQCVKNMHAVEYVKGMVWAMHEVTEKL